MSSLNPGGKRDCPGSGRVFQYNQIQRVLQQRIADRNYTKRARTSIALGNRNIRRIGPPYDCAPHEHKREIARRLRQQARRGA